MIPPWNWIEIDWGRGEIAADPRRAVRNKAHWIERCIQQAEKWLQKTKTSRNLSHSILLKNSVKCKGLHKNYQTNSVFCMVARK